MRRESLKFYYRGLIERGGPKNGYRWVEGWSRGENGKIYYPWSTRRECQKEAMNIGKKAVFVRGDAVWKHGEVEK